MRRADRASSWFMNFRSWLDKKSAATSGQGGSSFCRKFRKRQRENCSASSFVKCKIKRRKTAWRTTPVRLRGFSRRSEYLQRSRQGGIHESCELRFGRVEIGRRRRRSAGRPSDGRRTRSRFFPGHRRQAGAGVLARGRRTCAASAEFPWTRRVARQNRGNAFGQSRRVFPDFAS